MEELRNRYLNLRKDLGNPSETMLQKLNQALIDFMEITELYEIKKDWRFPQLQLLAFHTYLCLTSIDSRSKTKQVTSDILRAIFNTKSPVDECWK
jgi:hypothetical protein